MIEKPQLPGKLLDEFQQQTAVGDEPQPAVVDGQIQVRRNGSHFVLNSRADPQRALQFVGLAWLHQYRLRFVANSDNAVAEVGGVEVIRPVIPAAPMRWVKYCCSMATQPFWC